jgi:hypothetical protein
VTFSAQRLCETFDSADHSDGASKVMSETWGTRGKIAALSHDFLNRTETSKKLEMLVLQGASNPPGEESEVGRRCTDVRVTRPAVPPGLAGSATPLQICIRTSSG